MRNIRYVCVSLLIVGFAAAGAPGADDTAALLTAGLCDRPPLMDGRIADRAWRTGAGGSRFHVWPDAGYIRVTHDAEHLYIGLSNVHPQVEAMVVPDAQRDADIEHHESVEIFLAPDPAGGTYFHFVVSAANVQKDERCTDGQRDVSWNGNWHSAAQVSHKSWGVEIAIPFKTLGAARPADGDVWAFNVCRNAQGTDAARRVSWSPAVRDGLLHDPSASGRLRFARRVQATTVGHVADEFPGRATTDVFIHGIDSARFTVEAGAKDKPTLRFDQLLKPGNTRLQYDLGDSDEMLSVTVTDQTGATLWASGNVTTSAPDDWPAMENRIELPANDDPTERLLANGPKDPDGHPAYGLAVADAMVKVLPKRLTAYAGGFATTIDIAAARNEVEAAQVVLHSPKGDVKDIELDCSPLTDEAGNVIDAPSVWAAPVGYVKTEEPVAHAMPHIGWWPDPVLTYLDRFDVQQGDLATVWYSVRVSTDAVAGEYRGTLTIRPADAPAAVVPVTLTVWDFDLPKTPSLMTAIGHSVVNLHHKEETRQHITEVLEPIYEKFLVDHRTSPSHMYDPRRPSDAQLRRWRDWDVASYSIMHLDYRQLVRDEAGHAIDLNREFEQQCHEQIAESLKLAEQLGIADRAYVYMFDERVWPDFVGIRKASARLAEKFPNVRTLTTSDERTYGEQLPSIRAFCPLSIYYDPQSADDARARGKEVWWYVYAAPHPPYANVNLESPAIATRLLLGFMSHAYSVDGFLYYGMSRLKLNKQTLRSDGTYTDWIPRTWGPYNLDGHMYYPTPDGPITSVRFENWLDGLEDYEYLALLARRIEQRTQRLGDNDDLTRTARQTLQRYAHPDNDLVRTLTDYTHNPADLQRVRTHLATLIQRLAAE